MYCGFIDSLKGAIVLFYMDKQINERLLKASPARIDYHRKETNHSPAKSSKEPK